MLNRALGLFVKTILPLSFGKLYLHRRRTLNAEIIVVLTSFLFSCKDQLLLKLIAFSGSV